MIKEPKRMSFDEFVRQLRTVFDEIGREKEPILVEREGQVYRLELESAQLPEDIWDGYNPQRVRQALQVSAGALGTIDREALLEDLREQRKQASRGRPA